MLLSLREQLLRVLSLLIVIGLIVPPPAVWAVTPTIEPPVTLPLSGSLRYPIELDGDRVPTTNPIGLPVPVERFGAVDQTGVRVVCHGPTGRGGCARGCRAESRRDAGDAAPVE